MQNNPNNPYDDVFNNLAKIVEEIVKNMPDQSNARIIGYTIITRQSSGDPRIFRVGGNDDEEKIPYEVVESESSIFITAQLPPDMKNAPIADIQTNAVRICVDQDEATIVMNHPIDVIHSHYRVHRGVMDITLKKVMHL